MTSEYKEEEECDHAEESFSPSPTIIMTSEYKEEEECDHTEESFSTGIEDPSSCQQADKPSYEATEDDDSSSEERDRPTPPISPTTVKFDSIVIREYTRIIGDNPACSSGAPISLGWFYNPDREQELPLELFEKYREGKRRDANMMKMPPSIREQVLVNEWGVTMREIYEVSNENKKVQDQRIKTTKKVLRRKKLKRLINQAFCGLSFRKDNIVQINSKLNSKTIDDTHRTLSY